MLAARYVLKRVKDFKPGPDKYFVLGLPTGIYNKKYRRNNNVLTHPESNANWLSSILQQQDQSLWLFFKV